LSGTQLVGGVLAASTAAAIGARLGVAGTILGAALSSLVLGVAGSIYTASLRHTKHKLGSMFAGKTRGTTVEVDQISDDTIAGGQPEPDLARPIDATQSDEKVWSWDETEELPVQPAAAITAPMAAVGADDTSGRRVPWKPILVTSAAVFALTIAAITGFELITGQAVSGGEGTTITQVGGGGSGGDDAPKPASSPDSSQAPSTDSTGEPADEPRDEPADEPGNETSVAPSNEPTQEAEPAPQASQDPVEPPARGAPGEAPGGGGEGSEPDTE
ncbi:MAG: hypothetical protein L0H41_12280, partial [Microlunatus sp.]|nr:hypothetical protein [Microlunatus sp.]